MTRQLLEIPQPQLYHRLPSMSTEQLRAHAILSARLDLEWHRDRHNDRPVIQSFQCAPQVEHINLLPGGKWVVVVMHDGSLHLHELGAPAPAAVLAHSLADGESVFYLSSRLTVSQNLEDLVVLQMGVRYKSVYFTYRTIHLF